MDSDHKLLERDTPEEYLNEWREILKKKEPAKDLEDSEALLIFRLGKSLYALSVHALNCVAALVKPRKVPHRSSTVFLGIGNIEGALTLCFSLHKLLQEDASDGELGRMVVMEKEGKSCAFFADEIAGVERVGRNRVKKKKSPFLRGSFQRLEREVFLLDEEEVIRHFEGECGQK